MYAFVFNQSELQKLASEMLSVYSDVKIFTLDGDLGAGKTTFVKAICNALTAVDEVSSPTFSLVNEYETENGSCIYHMDLYRVEEVDELLNIGFEDYLHSGKICLIEWPSVGREYLDEHVHIQIEILDHGYRNFKFERKHVAN